MLAKWMAAAVLAAALPAGADEAATKLGGDELRALVTGAKVHHVTSAGNERRWTNDPDGTLVASTNNRKSGGAMARAASSPGQWSINESDKYCIEIDWKRELEKWCATIVKGEDGTYYLGKVDPARKIEFAK